MPEFDWRDHDGIIGPSRDQRPWNTCTSFALASVIESMNRIGGGAAISVDPGFIHTCLAHKGEVDDVDIDGHAPADLLDTLTAIGASGYALDRGKFPLPADLCPTFDALRQIAGFDPVGELQTIQNKIATHGPLAAEMYFYADFLSLAGAGVTYHPTPASEERPMSHTIVLIGYDDQGWIVKNSFGMNWGDQGCVRILYGTCGIDQTMPNSSSKGRLYAISL